MDAKPFTALERAGVGRQPWQDGRVSDRLTVSVALGAAAPPAPRSSPATRLPAGACRTGERTCDERPTRGGAAGRARGGVRAPRWCGVCAVDRAACRNTRGRASRRMPAWRPGGGPPGPSNPSTARKLPRSGRRCAAKKRKCTRKGLRVRPARPAGSRATRGSPPTPAPCRLAATTGGAAAAPYTGHRPPSTRPRTWDFIHLSAPPCS